MKLESTKVSLDKSAQEVFNFLTNVENFEQLMPENISKFKLLDTETFLFALSGMPEIVLKKKSMVSPHTVILGAAGGKLDFSLPVKFDALIAGYNPNIIPIDAQI